MLIVGVCGYTENHLPLAGVVAIGGRGKHLIDQVSLFGDGAVDERDDFPILFQYPEMVGITT